MDLGIGEFWTSCASAAATTLPGSRQIRKQCCARSVGTAQPLRARRASPNGRDPTLLWSRSEGQDLRPTKGTARNENLLTVGRGLWRSQTPEGRAEKPSPTREIGELAEEQQRPIQSRCRSPCFVLPSALVLLKADQTCSAPQPYDSWCMAASPTSCPATLLDPWNHTAQVSPATSSIVVSLCPRLLQITSTSGWISILEPSGVYNDHRPDSMASGGFEWMQSCRCWLPCRRRRRNMGDPLVFGENGGIKYSSRRRGIPLMIIEGLESYLRRLRMTPPSRFKEGERPSREQVNPIANMATPSSRRFATLLDAMNAESGDLNIIECLRERANQ